MKQAEQQMAVWDGETLAPDWSIVDFKDDQTDDTVNMDWLNSLPDHVLNHRHVSAPDLLPLNEVGVESESTEISVVPPLRSLSIQELLATPQTRYLVADLLPERGLMAFFGAPIAGKSALAIDLAGAIACGKSHWFGRRIAQARVAFVALEGNGGMRKRIKAWLAHTGLPIPSSMRLFTHGLSLLDEASTRELGRDILQDLGPRTVSVIDTLSRAMAGGDENNSADMTTIISNAELLGSITEGPVILVHHTGKDAGRGLRGHSSLLGAVDVAVEVVNDKGNRSWTLRKNKDGADGGVNAFDLMIYAVDTDQWGDEVTSCAVRQQFGAPRPSLPPVSGSNKIPVMTALRAALATAPGGLTWANALQLAAIALTRLGARRNTVARTTVESLVSSGHLVRTNDFVSLPT